MFWINLKRVFRSGWINFRRNGLISSAAVLITAITLSLITALFMFHAVLNASLATLANKVDIAVYFDLNAPEEKILALQNTLKKLPEVKSVDYVSADEQVTNFRNHHSDDFLTLQALDELNQNPFGGVITIKATDPNHYGAIVNILEGDTKIAKDNSQIIEKINYSQNQQIIEKINTLNHDANKVGLITIIILAAVSIIIMFTTIRLTIYIWREEIGIMKLVGASSAYVRAPFLVEGMLYGVFAWLIVLAIFLPVTYYLGAHATDLIGLNLFSYFIGNMFTKGLLVLVVGITLGVVSSMIAVRKYLNV